MIEYLWPEGALRGDWLLNVNQFIAAGNVWPGVYVLIQAATDNGDAGGLEEIGDRLVARIQRRPWLDEPAQALKIAYLAYRRAFDIRPKDRSRFLAVKALSIEIMITRFEVEDNDDKDLRQKITERTDQVAQGLLPGTPEEDVASQLRVLLEVAAEAADHNLQLSLALADWTHRQTREFEFATADPGGLIKQRASALHIGCLKEMTELTRGWGLPWASLEHAEQAAYLSAYAAMQPDEARRLANDVLSAGDRLAVLTDDKEGLISLSDRLYRASRLTRDVTTIGDRFERLGQELRRRGRDDEDAGRWVQAADAYSNLGYRYFIAGEYTGLARLYLLSIYYFEKAEVLRDRDPAGGNDHDSDDPNAPEPGHRKQESEGFIYGASARLAGLSSGTELFDQAALTHERAARMVFGKLGLHVFYTTASNFFDAHSCLARIARTDSLREICLLLAGAVDAFHTCGQSLQQVFSSYEAVLSRLLNGDQDPCPAGIQRELTRTMHPDAAGIAAQSAVAAAALAAGDAGSLRAAAAALSSLFIFLYPD
jgi:hypothetical protein